MDKNSAAPPAFFPMLVNLHARRCVVVGAGKVAAEKINGLLLHGAQVTVISPRAVEQIRMLSRSGALIWRRRCFSAEDIGGALLVVAATNSPATNESVFRACQAQGILCNAVDEPEHCDFFYPAVVRRGPLQIAISTGGRSPALAARLRRELERQFGPEWSAWVEHVGELRRELLAGKMPDGERRRRLQRMVSPAAFRAFAQASARKKAKAKPE
jgi:precorrin-2 dehydrogenase/sirohydrochlorin ferrochelatase